MTEYKIRGTKNMEFLSDGHRAVTENVPPIMSGYGSYSTTYNNLETASKELEACKKDIEDWCERHNANAVKDKKYGVIIHWTNIHLVSREVSEWEEVK